MAHVKCIQHAGALVKGMKGFKPDEIRELDEEQAVFLARRFPQVFAYCNVAGIVKSLPPLPNEVAKLSKPKIDRSTKPFADVPPIPEKPESEGSE